MVQIPRITSSASSNERGPLVEFDSECGEFALQVPDADREREAAVGQQVQRRAGLRHHERVAVRQHDDVRDQPQGRGVGGGVPHGDEGVEASWPPASSQRCEGAGWSVNPKPWKPAASAAAAT